jgi:hypothetical protein
MLCKRRCKGHERTGWLAGPKGADIIRTASIFEVPSGESINSFVWTWYLPLVIRYHSDLMRCDKNIGGRLFVCEHETQSHPSEP